PQRSHRFASVRRRGATRGSRPQVSPARNGSVGMALCYTSRVWWQLDALLSPVHFGSPPESRAALPTQGATYDATPHFPPRRPPHGHRFGCQPLDRLFRLLTRHPHGTVVPATDHPGSMAAGHSVRNRRASTARRGAAEIGRAHV